MRISELAALVQKVTWSGDRNFTGLCPAHPDHSPSLSVTEADDGRLLVKCHTGCEAEDIMRAVGRGLGDLYPAHVRLASNNGQIPPFLRLWRQSVPAAGTLAESYIRARDISMVIPPSLRFLPDAVYQDGEVHEQLPAIIAPIQIDREIIGVHRTYLAINGLGKADVAKPKKMLGAAKGGAVRLGPSAVRIGIAEGIETALAAMQADTLPVWAALSAGGMKELNLPLGVKEVVIYADADPAGAAAAQMLAERLLLNKVQVGIKTPPAGKDFNNLLHEGGENAIREIPVRWLEQSKTANLPVIDARNGDLWAMLNTITKAVSDWNSPPKLFIHENTGQLVKLVWRAPKSNRSSQRTYLSLEKVTVAGYRNILAAAARWVVYRRSGPEASFPPLEVVTSAYDHAHEGQFLPLLRAIVYAPTCTPSGRFLRPGYDAETRLWYAAEDDDPSDEDTDPDPAALDKARGWLDDALFDFQFETESDRAHAFTLFLLPFVRELIDGPIPLYNIEAPIAGTGKGLLARVLLRPSGSHRMVPETRREEELEKQIAAVCINSWPTAVIDNVNNVVNSPMLASIVTSRNPEIRMMGGYQMIQIMRVPIFVLTANNPTFSEENARRAARIRITTDLEQPSEREGFKHPYLEMWVEEVRAELCQAAVTMVKAWLKSGRPQAKGRLWGSFEAWSDVMGSLTAFLGYKGFGQARITKDSIDRKESRWRDLVEAWGTLYEQGGTYDELKTSDLVVIADGLGDFFMGRERDSKEQVIGNSLGHRKGRIFGLWKLQASTREGGFRRWQIIKMV